MTSRAGPQADDTATRRVADAPVVDVVRLVRNGEPGDVEAEVVEVDVVEEQAASTGAQALGHDDEVETLLGAAGEAHRDVLATLFDLFDLITEEVAHTRPGTFVEHA